MNRNVRQGEREKERRGKSGAPGYEREKMFWQRNLRQKPDRWKRILFRYCQGTVLLAASGLLILAVWLQTDGAVRQQETSSGEASVTAAGGTAEDTAEITGQGNSGTDAVTETGAGGAAEDTAEVTGEGAPGTDAAAETGAGSAAEISAQEEAAADTEPKRAALTFDDGPHPVYTKMLLDGLKERQICATFFVIGENIPGNEDLIARMAEEGHIIGNHTYSHVKISDMDIESACEQVEKTSVLIKAITGQDTEFVRPPFGEWNKALETCFVMIPVLWDVDPLDWTTKNTDLVVQRVLSEVGDGDIILLHDCYESSVLAALQIADTLTAQGWEFVTVDELILE